MLATPAFASRVHQAPTSGHHRSHSAKTKSDSSESRSSRAKSSARARGVAAKTRTRSHGQQAIAPERVLQIQQALIREHYLTGEPTGTWDSETLAAMQKFQADQGWQTKLMPDSRALKKLGLGPDYSNAINAQTSSFAAPIVRGTTSAEQSAAFAEAAGARQ